VRGRHPLRPLIGASLAVRRRVLALPPDRREAVTARARALRQRFRR
jgi:hypothetical protein